MVRICLYVQVCVAPAMIVGAWSSYGSLLSSSIMYNPSCIPSTTIQYLHVYMYTCTVITIWSIALKTLTIITAKCIDADLILVTCVISSHTFINVYTRERVHDEKHTLSTYELHIIKRGKLLQPQVGIDAM